MLDSHAARHTESKPKKQNIHIQTPGNSAGNSVVRLVKALPFPTRSLGWLNQRRNACTARNTQTGAQEARRGALTRGCSRLGKSNVYYMQPLAVWQQTNKAQSRFAASYRSAQAVDVAGACTHPNTPTPVCVHASLEARHTSTLSDQAAAKQGVDMTVRCSQIANCS